LPAVSAPKQSIAASLDERFDGASSQQAWTSTRSQNSNRSVNGPALASGGNDRFGFAAPTATFDCRGVPKRLSLPLANSENRHRFDLHQDWTTSIPHPLAILHVFNQRILMFEVFAMVMSLDNQPPP